MTSRKLKLAILILLANALGSIAYVVALREGRLPLPAGAHAWTSVVPDFVFFAIPSLLAAYGLARRRTWGFALGMVAAGSYVGSAGPGVVRFFLELAHVGAPSGAPSPAVVPYASIYFSIFGLVLAVYLWTRRTVFAVGV